MDDAQVPLEVVGVRVELPSNQPVLILRGVDAETEGLHVAVVVGPAEAAAVARALQGEVPPRPMTHDLLTSVLETLGQGVEAVEVRLLDASTYAGTIHLNNGKQIDARASDAIAVAVRAHCEVTMKAETLRAVSVTPRYRSTESAGEGRSESTPGASPEAATVTQKGPISEDEIREFQKFLSDAGPEDFDRS
ncbi:bifunctional nuclease family protein [Nesterenkonia sp. MY13]|uniref:Bifunctional nuclease family protein n=1 Tax=Nesterenkonia sedimenti TaxID=1463632 RepID=A0A7X8YEQ2_9MICC|nr:bifunctional nuclease family protein [Nesterenkonia sedimenti]NLS10586.1 bifunctional nuclease family protein [Nesterenkonia sedimenti]